MGYQNEDARSVILDLETVAIDGVEALVEAPSAPANYKDPKKIADYIAEASAAQVAKAALYPWTARIVALGLWVVGEDAPRVRVTPDEDEEREALRTLWAAVVGASGAVSPLVTFNGLGFDLPVLMVRSRLLGVPAPSLNLDRYRSPHPDLLQILTFRGAIQARSLKWFAARFGLDVADETSGADIGALVTAGDLDGIRAHCESDVRLTRGLAEHMGLVASDAQVAA